MLLPAIVACKRNETTTRTNDAIDSGAFEPLLFARFQPVPETAANPITPEKGRARPRALLRRATLEQARPRLRDLHMLGEDGVDNEPTSTGHKGQHGTRNAPKERSDADATSIVTFLDSLTGSRRTT